jgi:hypothetical protein
MKWLLCMIFHGRYRTTTWAGFGFKQVACSKCRADWRVLRWR